MPNDNLKYMQSISAEFKAIQDRVRFFIGDAHWGEDGRYKEVILQDYLRSIMPNNVGVGTGFVKNLYGELTSQIDIILYKKDIPRLFQKDDFVILMPESVLGIIEVKSAVNSATLCSTENSPIEKSHRNGKIIEDNIHKLRGHIPIFNGIFAFSNKIKASLFIDFSEKKLYQSLKNNSGYINNICIGEDYFIRYWPKKIPYTESKGYRIYDLSADNINKYNYEIDKLDFGLSIGYFISNLLETVISKTTDSGIPNQYYEFLYPLENTKELYKVENCDVIRGNDE